MTLTILASIFLVLILLFAFIGFRVGMKPAPPAADINTEKCAVCREKFNKATLIERQIGDYKLMYFCPSCITKLHQELIQNN